MFKNIPQKEYWNIVSGALLMLAGGSFIAINSPPQNFINWVFYPLGLVFIVWGILCEVSASGVINNKLRSIEEEIAHAEDQIKIVSLQDKIRMLEIIQKLKKQSILTEEINAFAQDIVKEKFPYSKESSSNTET